MNSSDNDDHINNLNNAIISIYKYVLPVFYVGSNLGNFLSLLIFFKKPWKKNVCVFYFKVALLVNSCYINSTILGTIFINGFQINLQNSSLFVCKVYMYVSFLFATLSPTVLILASIDRLLISSQNVDTRLYSSKRLAYFSISISTVFWIIFNLHVLIKVSIHEIYPSYFLCSYDLPTSYLDFVSYSLGVINIVCSLLMICLCMFAFKNVRHVRAIPRDQRQRIRSMTKKDFQLLRCLYVQDIVYIMFGSSVILYYIYETMTKDQIRTELADAIRHFLNKFFSFLYNTSYSTNFLVFVIVSKAFRRELRCLIYKFLGQNLNPIREEAHIRRNNVEINVVSTIELRA